MQQWEYRIILRTRTLVGSINPMGLGVMVGNEFSPNGDDMLRELASMGHDGWELVSVMPRVSIDSSPITSEEVWVFKRPVG